MNDAQRLVATIRRGLLVHGRAEAGDAAWSVTADLLLRITRDVAEVLADREANVLLACRVLDLAKGPLAQHAAKARVRFMLAELEEARKREATWLDAIDEFVEAWIARRQ